MEGLGLETRVAENGAQCVTLFQEWHPHLIWMDRRMPVMDGVEGTRRIRLLPGGGRMRKIVAVTASVFKEERQELFDAEMSDFVRKPYRFHEIRDCLARHLGLKYVYQTTAPKEADTAPVTLTPAMLAVLPEEMRGELREALSSLDSDPVAALIRQLSETNVEPARARYHMAENFDYPAILHALELSACWLVRFCRFHGSVPSEVVSWSFANPNSCLQLGIILKVLLTLALHLITVTAQLQCRDQFLSLRVR